MNVKELRCEYKKNPVGIDVLIPRFGWILDSDLRNVMQTAYLIQVSKDDAGFTYPFWDSGRVNSDNSVHAEYGGPVLLPRTRYYFRVKVWDNHGFESEWSEPAFWETGILNAWEWSAWFITPEVEIDSSKPAPCPALRKEFNVAGEIKSARVYATGLGLYELRINGEKADDQLLTPGWTSYNKRLQYQTYDVTLKLKNGNNAVGVLLGDGWYKGNLGWVHQKNVYGTRVCILMQLHIKYTDGTEQVVVSDNTWKSSTSPILMSEIYHGEIYDSRLEMSGWDEANFDDSGWGGVKELDVPKNILVAQENVPIRKIEEIKPVSIFKTPAGETVIDMGQNMVGWLRFRVSGPEGSKVVLKHFEVMNKEGNVYTENLRSARQTMEYILKGAGEETFEPHFTFQGFRYVKVEEYPGELSPDNFTGIVLHSDMDHIGRFECSNELLNKLQHNILWGLKGNFIDVPTDCPQRDERLGWTGDAQVFIRTACFNMNTVPFFEKWLRDLKADQLKNGGVPWVIPHVLNEDHHSSSGWGDAAVICPWTIYLCCGDERVLREQYDSMKSWVEYIRGQAENGLIWNTGFHFGDWLALDAKEGIRVGDSLGLDEKEGNYFGATPNDFISTAFYAYSTGLLARTTKVLKKSEDEKTYSRLHDDIVKAFREEFFTITGRLAVTTQTAYVLALMFDLVEKKHRKRTVDALVKNIEENNLHLTTGFLGAPYLCHVLSQNGRPDTAYKLLIQTDYPSWLYQVAKGATTVWEHWDGIKPDGSFWSPDMNSFNHYAYGAIGDWMYRVVAGLDTDEEKPGYKHAVIKPQPGGQLQFACAELKSMYGVIKSAWRIEADTMVINLTIPHNTTAAVTLPGAKIESLMENDSPIGSTDLFPRCRETGEGVVIELFSGVYTFTYKFKIFIPQQSCKQ